MNFIKPSFFLVFGLFHCAHFTEGTAYSRPNEFRCPFQGFHADPLDCKAFYKCVDWDSNSFFTGNVLSKLTAVRFTCAGDTVFDPESNTCSNPRYTWRKECGGRSLDDTGNDDLPYYYPSRGNGGEYYKENENEYPSLQHGGNGYPTGNQGRWQEDENQILQRSISDCTSEGFFPVPGDCYHFRRCVEDGVGGYREFVFRCAPGTVWDQSITICNFPGSVPGCGAGEQLQGTSENQQGDGNSVYPGNDSNGNGNQENNSALQEEGNPLDQMSNHHGGHSSGLDNQNQMGYPQQGSRPPEQSRPQQGSTKPNQGNYPSSGGYPEQMSSTTRYPNQGSYPNPEPAQGSQTELGNLGENSQNGDTGDDADEGNHVQAGNPSECQSDGFFGVNGDCVRFYRCVDNGNGGYFRYDFECGKETVWDQESITCNYPWAVHRNDVNCSTVSNSHGPGMDAGIGSSTDGHDNVSSTSSVPFESKGTQSPNTTPSPQTTKMSQQTVNNQQTMTPTEMSSTMKPGSTPPQIDSGTTEGKISTSAQTTVPPGSRPSSPQSNSKVECKKSGNYPYPGNCKKFYRCVDWDGDKGERFSVYYFECGEGTIWDPALETCNHEESVYPPRDCGGGGGGGGEEEGNETNRPTTEGTMTTNQATPTSDAVDQTTSPSDTETTTAVPGVTDQSTTVSDAPDQTTTSPDPTDQPTTAPDSTDQTTIAAGLTEQMSTTEEKTTMTTFPNTEMTTNTSTDSTTPNSGETVESNQPEEQTTTDSATDVTQPINTTETFSSTADSSSENQTETTTDKATGETEASSCPPLGEGQVAFACPTGFRRHPKDCNLFYQCTMTSDGDASIMTLSCKNETVYDEEKIQCLPPDATSQCSSMQARTRRYRKIDFRKPSIVPVESFASLCPREGNFPYDCRRFFKCHRDHRGKLQGYLYQCPEKYLFSMETGRCEKTSKLPPCPRSHGDLSWTASKFPIEPSGSDSR